MAKLSEPYVPTTWKQLTFEEWYYNLSIKLKKLRYDE